MNLKVLIRGGGDLATGIIHRLFKSGMEIIVTELPEPLVIRKTVAFASAVYEGNITVEGVTAKLENSLPQVRPDYIPVLIDPECNLLKDFTPHVLVDARMIKSNTDTRIDMAPLVIGLGPGFQAGADCHKVIETMRGHYLGRVIDKGCAIADTGIPGEIKGASAKRVVRAPESGIFRAVKTIGDNVSEGEVLGEVEGAKVYSRLTGVLRGLIQNGLRVKKGLKIADVDPRAKKEYINTISDKARALGGSVLEAILSEFSDRITFI